MRFFGKDSGWFEPTARIVELLLLAFTAYWIWLYTTETQRLRQDGVELRIDAVRPVIAFTVINPYKLSVTNIGKGPAMDIELRLSQVQPTGGLTNLANLLTQDAERDLLTLGEAATANLGGSETIRQYAVAQDPSMRWGQHEVFAAIATYVDINRRPYYTLSLIRSIAEGPERRLVLKATKTAYYGSGDIEKLRPLDWGR